MTAITIDPQILRTALREAWMAGRVDLGDIQWARGDEYALATIARWDASTVALDWCPVCHAHESEIRARPDPAGDPGEKRDWLSTIIHRLPCIPATSALTPAQYEVYRLGWRHGIKEAGKVAKHYIDPRLMSARRMTQRAERLIAELIGAPPENEKTENP